MSREAGDNPSVRGKTLEDNPFWFRIGDRVWYQLEVQYGRGGEQGQYEVRRCDEVLCFVTNITGKRVMLRKIGDPESVRPFAVLADKIS